MRRAATMIVQPLQLWRPSEVARVAPARQASVSSSVDDPAMSVLDLSRRLLALSQTGLHFTQEEYDRERYREMAQIASELLALESNLSPEQLRATWMVEDGYATPKIDVRGAVFRDDQVLMVKERVDGKWTLPGGWADVNDTPSRAVEKEIEQESGFTAHAVKLAAVLDRNLHNHPKFLFHVWKMFFICEITGGDFRTSYETTDVKFFPVDQLPELSTGRTTAEQIQRAYRHHLDRSLPTEFD
jgi:ADP-ribose pyrophosphatase YjhB (NUDIX family)